jgi:WD40 repeat protein
VPSNFQFRAGFIFASLAMSVSIAWCDARGGERIVARLWSYDAATSSMIESRFVINSTHSTEEHPSTNYGILRAERKRADAEAYQRLLATVRRQREPIPDGELSTALEAVDAAKSYGDLPESRVLASPDGQYVALAPQFSRSVIVNTITLETHRLLDRSDLEVPMAWSWDSQTLAFAPSETSGQIFIYDVGQHSRRSTLGGPKRLISALEWSLDNSRLASLELVNRRLHKTPFGLLIAFSGHPDFRNDLVLRVYGVTGDATAPLQLKQDLTEQSSYDYWIEWH